MHKPLVNHVLFRPKASRHRGDFFKRAITCFALRKMKIFSWKGFRIQAYRSRTNRGGKGKLVRGQTPVIEKGKRDENVGKKREERKKKKKERGEKRKVSEGSFVSLLDLMPS